MKTKVKEETVVVEKYVDVAELSLIKSTKEEIDGKMIDTKVIDMDNLEIALTSIKLDADKANKGNKAAGRRFRLNTTAISKHFLEIRKLTPRAKVSKK
jgi:hypothetical protein